MSCDRLPEVTRHLIVGSANEGNVSFVDLELNSAKGIINLMKYLVILDVSVIFRCVSHLLQCKITSVTH